MLFFFFFLRGNTGGNQNPASGFIFGCYLRERGANKELPDSGFFFIYTPLGFSRYIFLTWCVVAGAARSVVTS